jgi:hypothetical protein
MIRFLLGVVVSKKRASVAYAIYTYIADKYNS